MNKIKLTNKFHCKNILKDTHKLIKTKRNFWKIPVEPGKTINNIMMDYQNYAMQKSKNKDKKFIEDVIWFIKNKFNEMLPLMLLYKEERIKFNQQFADEKLTIDFCNIFGITHLLRLIVKLHDIIYITKKENLELFQKEVEMLLDFLESTEY